VALRCVRAVRPAVAGALLALLATAVPDRPLQARARVSPQAAAAADSTVLDAAPIQRRLARGDEHLYRLALTAGEYARVIVEQHGIDVAVQTRQPDGTVIADFQDEYRRDGVEQAEIVAAAAAGTYTLAITAPPGSAASGAFYVIRLVTRRVATDADRAIQESRGLRTAAARFERVGKLDDARPLIERALALAEPLRGPDDPYVIWLVRDLAGNAFEGTHDAPAKVLYERALAALQKTAGTESPDTAIVQSRLAVIAERQGQRPRAEAMLRQSMEILERTVGTEHKWYVRCLITQAHFRSDAGEIEKGVELNRRALEIMERIGDTDTVSYSGVMNNLGDMLTDLHDYVHAEEMLQRALTLGEAIRGPDNLFVSYTLQNLGIVARQQKKYTEAEAYLRRSLAIRQHLFGPDHPDVAAILVNLSNVQSSRGDYRASLDTLFRVVPIWEKVSSGYSRGMLLTMGNIARRYAALGDVPNAIAYQRRVDAIIERQFGINLALGSERQKLAFVDSMAERTERTLSLSFREAAGDPDAAALATTVLLQRKGRVLDAMIDTFAGPRQRLTDAKDNDLLDQLKAATAQLAELALSVPRGDQAFHGSQLKAAEDKKEALEVLLGEHNAEIRARLQPVTLDAVQAAIPDEAALIEFAVYRPFDPRAEIDTESYGAPHYAAYVVRRHMAPRGYDLGSAQTIDDAIDTLRQALRDPGRTDLKRHARLVDEQVMQPLRAALGDATQLLISPDGDLNLVPVEALIDEHGQYLIEHYAISYLTSGRDLLRMQTMTQTSLSPPVVVADPYFGEPATPGGAPPTDAPAQTRTQTRTRAQTGTAGAGRAARRSVTVARDLSTVYFAPLAGTAAEARTIKTLFPEATMLTGPRATKALLAGVKGPSMLHIASHGFFLEDGTHDGGDAPGPAGSRAAPGTRAMSASVKVENPLLRSGIALAGANLRREAHDDGILTALEASGLNLWGTKLVTLSACDTGVGEVRNGEGVYGLRRAFVLAGAETLVMSLWPVSDYMTRQMMTPYYTGLRAGLGRGDALRQAKLALLKKSDPQHPARHPFEHPFYWASFIQSGEWANLAGAR
jgi:CHAT domain-containing protein